MTILAQSIFNSAKTALTDADAVHWKSAELMDYLNAGIRQLVIFRPDASTKLAAFIPAFGARQQLPNDAIAFIDIIGNTSGKQRAVTKVDINLLSAYDRDWQSSQHKATAQHFMYEMRDPRTFYMYPPADGNGSIDLLYSVFPADVTNWSDTINLNPQWTTPLMNYVVGRALAKDAEYGGNAKGATAYMSAFANDIGVQQQASTTVTNKA